MGSGATKGWLKPQGKAAGMRGWWPKGVGQCRWVVVTKLGAHMHEKSKNR